MDDQDWPEHFEITSLGAIEMLASLRTLRFLNPFMLDAQTQTSAAQVIGRPPSSMAYWVPRFLEAGLIIHIGDIARAGRPMPVYRAPGRQLTVPFSRLPFDQRVALLDDGRTRVLNRFLDGLDEAIAESEDFSLAFSPSGPTGYSLQMVEKPDPNPRHFTDGWMSLELTREDALDLSAEMEALVKKYSGRGGPKKYVAHAGVAPAAKHPWRSIDDPLGK